MEAILDGMYKSRPRGLVAKLLRREPAPETLDAFCKLYGGYIGEVLRRQGGGEWFFDEEIVPGETIVGLRKGSQRIWPTWKVGKRLTNGVEDNVWAYFTIMRKQW